MSPLESMGYIQLFGIFSHAPTISATRLWSLRLRDYANVSQLVCLSNMENLNAVFIGDGIPQGERLKKLNTIAISQMKLLTEDHRVSTLNKKPSALLTENGGEEK